MPLYEELKKIRLTLADLQAFNSGVATTPILKATQLTASYTNATQLTASYTNTTQLTASSATVSNSLVCSGNVLVNNGNGIDFSSTSDTSLGTKESELFNDYEEGTWTPVVSGSSTVGTGGYGTQVGRYTKIGRIVHLQAYIAWTTHDGTGNLLIGNLPYATITSNAQSTAFAQYTSLTVPASSVAFLQCASNSRTINVLSIATAGASSAALAIDTNATMSFSITYETA